MPLIVADLMDDLKEILGRCDQDTIFKRLTDALVVCATKGRYDLTTGMVDLCTGLDGRTLTLPRDIDTPLAVNVNGQPAYFRNKWMEFHFNGAGSFQEVPWAWDDKGWFPVFMDIITPSYLVAVADLKNDLGCLVRVFGYDQNGQWIRTQNPDGSWEDGFLVPVNILSDFPNGIPVPDTDRVFSRIFSTVPMTEFVSSSAHQLSTGAFVTLSLITPPLPTPLSNGGQFFLRAIDATHVSLHASLSGAQTNTGIIQVTAANPASVISLTDRRVISVLTQFNSSIPTNMRTGIVMQFSATTFPTPIEASTDYFARVIDDNNFTAHATLDDATNNVNPIDVSTPGTGVSVQARQPINPITELDFSVNHNFLQGDAVQVKNDSGQLPEPLLEGVTYFVRVISAKRITLHLSLADSSTGDNPIVLLSSGSGPSRLIKTIACSANVGTSNNITCVGHNLTIQQSFSQVSITNRQRTSDVATLAVGTPHGFTTGDFVAITGMSDASYNAPNAKITVVSTTSFSYSSIGTNEASTPEGSGKVQKFPTSGDFVQFTTNGTFPAPLTQDTTFLAEPPMSADTFTVCDTSGNPINILATGAGQLFLVISRVFTIDFTSQWQTIATKIVNGTTVKMSSTGTLPATTPAINPSTTYFARKIDDSRIELYDTLARSTDTTIRQSLNRARSSNIATIQTQANHGFVNGDFVDISGVGSTLDGVLQSADVNAGGAGYVDGETVNLVDGGGHTASAQITVSGGAITFFRILNGGSGFSAASTGTVSGGSGAGGTYQNGTISNGVQVANSPYNGTRLQITVTAPDTFTYTSVGLDEPTTSDTNGQIIVSDIKVNGVGTGDVSLVFDRNITAVPFSSLLKLSNSQFLQDGATIRFETDGTLPSPLLPLTDFFLSLSGGLLQVKDNLNNNIVLTDIGSGNHSMVITRNFSVVIPTDVEVTNNEYNNGDAVTLASTGTLPTPLTAIQVFLRRIDEDHVEIYDTAAHAIDTNNTTGRIVPLDTGSGVQTMVQIVPNFNVQKVTRVTKTETNGFIRLSAFDTGRTDTMTVIGQYFPDETEPMYRRLRLGFCCSWVRLRYQRTIFKIKSTQDFVPIRSKQAILMMVRALELYKSEFNDRAKAFEIQAEQFLKDDQLSSNGPNSVIIQFNDDVWTNPDEQTMDAGWGRPW